MKTQERILSVMVVACAIAVIEACGDDESQADKVGIGAECTDDDDCTEADQTCLTEFKGGYCGKSGCTSNRDCPESSACVAHDNGTNYCFRICTDKAECNRNRTPDVESNCSSSVTFVEDATDVKTCLPPSSGTDGGTSTDKKSK